VAYLAPPVQAKRLWHELRAIKDPVEGVALLTEALEYAARRGFRDPELDYFAVLRHAVCEATWELEMGEGKLRDRVLRADALLREACGRVDVEAYGATCFREAEEEKGA